MKDTRYIHTRYNHACGVCGLFSWSLAAALLAFSSHQFTLTIKHGPSLCPLHTIFPSWASVAGGVCRPRSEAPCILVYGVYLETNTSCIWKYKITFIRNLACCRWWLVELIMLMESNCCCWCSCSSSSGEVDAYVRGRGCRMIKIGKTCIIHPITLVNISSM